ncbi:PAS domain S-box protein [Domibacillus sp. A3M-37]|uniref:histidine kinase dimerization/phospho-acceptor domain-containing protein n=1 Tax=Domibacillus sp. A3M-37 TaxID=2962037 RepID=UPI0020B75DAD|nr:histidine kinase dimerization/phospho-acceptor domain-containing protein [Domibacillus sp. A3M-37]MCP3761361.1 PAS domain S-box protein [Domibacillus sp. A3M-37]
MKDYHYRVVTTPHLSQAAAHSNMSMLETIRISNDGKAYHMMLSITPIFDYEERVSNWAVHLRDITAQKEIEKKLLRAEILVSAGKMAAGVTHEIRNPLTSLKGLLQLMRAEGEYNHDYVATMAKEVNQIETFVDETSLLAMPEAPPCKMIDLNPLLHSVISLLDTQAIMSNFVFTFKHDPLPPVLCNEESIKKSVL